MKKYKSKWALIGIKKKKLKQIYGKQRIKAYTILKDNNKKEYSLILNNLMNTEYKIYSTGYELLPFGKMIRIREHLKQIYIKELKGGIKEK